MPFKLGWILPGKRGRGERRILSRPKSRLQPHSRVVTGVLHPLPVPALGQLPAALHTHSTGHPNGVDLIVPERGNVGENAREPRTAAAERVKTA